MDSKDFKNVCMAASGLAMTAAGSVAMYATGTPAAVDVSMDAVQIAATIATGVLTGGVGLALLGLAPLVVKYGYKFIQLVKQKLQEKYHMNSKSADKVMKHALSKDTKSSSRGIAKEEGDMKNVMQKAYKHSDSLRRAPRRSARNPVIHNVSRASVSRKQEVH